MPTAVTILKKYEIDMCCNGHKSLQEVCATRSDIAPSLVKELDLLLCSENPSDHD